MANPISSVITYAHWTIHSPHFLISILPISYLWRILRQPSYLCRSTPSKNYLPLPFIYTFFSLFRITYTVFVSSTCDFTSFLLYIGLIYSLFFLERLQDR